jgi:hypothetical protein
MPLNITYYYQKLKIRNANHSFKPFISSVLLESKSLDQVYLVIPVKVTSELTGGRQLEKKI